jgi:hypothetical protein
MAFPAFPIFELRRADEDRPAFSFRVIVFVMTEGFVPARLDAESADLACSQSVALYGRDMSGVAADAINRAVIMLRDYARRERERTTAALVALGWTNEPKAAPAGAPAPAAHSTDGRTFSPAQFDVLAAGADALIAEHGGNDDDSGHKVRVRKPKPVNPPAGCAAPF